ncbi:unnamed protein product [Arabis nemorensis]|uniref:t-SNARE coiled-coil homology domain-containing protein n=1 Tax=Arabis nemorensis TaxID=586526 RepID=A0A565CAL2_9BRAS|nr:unnamed protein product [Arabis nemorensis]
MAANPHRGGADGSFYGGAAPYRSSDGLSTRNAATGSEEIQLRIDPMHSDLDDEITGLHGQVRQLKNIAQEIGSEAKSQRDFLDELQMTLIRAQAGVKNNIRKLNMSIIRSGNNHIMHVVLFALVCFFILYMWSDDVKEIKLHVMTEYIFLVLGSGQWSKVQELLSLINIGTCGLNGQKQRGLVVRAGNKEKQIKKISGQDSRLL